MGVHLPLPVRSNPSIGLKLVLESIAVKRVSAWPCRWVIAYPPPDACNSTATRRTSLVKVPVERE